MLSSTRNAPFGAMMVAFPRVWLICPAHVGSELGEHPHDGGVHDEYNHTVSCPEGSGVGLLFVSFPSTPNRLHPEEVLPYTVRSVPVVAPRRRSTFPAPRTIRRAHCPMCSVFMFTTVVVPAAPAWIRRSVNVLQLPDPPDV